MLASLVFLNPFTMMVGGALIASPIIIHLINRMRFKRVRWAAMEFLLKAQKRSRRRMIIEQLFLLLLRILLVLLIAVLLSRLVEKKETPPPESKQTKKEAPKTTQHVIILDDSASMADLWKEEGGDPKGQEPFLNRARKLVKDAIINTFKDDNNAHEFVIIRLSKPDEPTDFKILTDETKSRIERYVDETKAQDFHYELAPALEKAQAIFDAMPEKNLALHILSDYRAVDWNGATRDSLSRYFEHFEKALVQVKLYDAAAPKREPDKALVSNDNLAIVDLRPDSRIAIKDAPVEFSVTITNFGGSDEQNVSVRLRVNNEERREGSLNFEKIRAHDTVTRRVALALNRTAPKVAADQDDKAKYDGFNLISAHLGNHKSGLTIDDVRYTVVEVRDKLSILLVDNDTAARTLIRTKGRDDYLLNKNAEAFYLWKLFKADNSDVDVTVRTAAELEKFDLASYSAVVLCNIPALSPAAVAKLDAFLNAGGGVGFFMGPAIRDPKFYNEALWREGHGIFPAPLKEIANASATVEQLDKIQYEQRLSLYKKLVVRNEMRRHPALEKLYTESRGSKVLDTSYENTFYGVSFPRYYVVDRPKWKHGDETQALLYLANSRSIADFERPTREFLRKLREAADEITRRQKLQQRIDDAADPAEKERLKKDQENLKAEMEKFAKYQAVLKDYADNIANTVGKYDNPLYKLVLWLDEVLLQDPGDPNQGRPSMIEFWQAPELADLKQDLLRLIDDIKYGDPFYIAKQYKKGRVLAFMGGAGLSGPEAGYWNPLNSPNGQPYFPPLMKDSLQRYLCSNNPYSTSTSDMALPLANIAGGAVLPVVDNISSDFYLSLGKPFLFDLPLTADAPTIEVWHMANNDRPVVEEDKVKFTSIPVKQKPQEAGAVPTVWRFADGNQPGVYLFGFLPRAAETTKNDVRPDLRALAYNFDTRLESNLLRARTDEVTAIARVKQIEDEASAIQPISKQTLDSKSFEEEDLGWSRSPWLYLGLLIVLILEQAWAVRLSFHVRPGPGPLGQPLGGAGAVA